MNPRSGKITELLHQLRGGDQDAKERLFRLVYPELRRIAAARLRRERRGHTMQTGDLIHEVYLRLFDTTNLEIKDRTHFYAVAALFMRRVLVDHARRRASRPHRVELSPELMAEQGAIAFDHARILAIHQALNRLEEMDRRQGQIVEMRFFGGMSIEEIADVLELTSRTIKRDWSMARAWLLGELAS